MFIEMKTEEENQPLEPENDCEDKSSRALATITHDLKSPLAAIQGLARHLRDEMEEKSAPKEWLDVVDRISRATAGLSELSNNILSMAKIEAGNELVEPAPIEDLAAELEITLETFELEALSKNIDLILDAEKDYPTVHWDIIRIRHHTLNNLISNALRFTPEGGRITLAAHTKENYMEIRVADTGPGVPKDEREKLFDRFVQSDLSSSRVFSSMGLGLHNAKLFVERHGGTIRVEDNTATGHGAVFVIELPIHPTV